MKSIRGNKGQNKKGTKNDTLRVKDTRNTKKAITLKKPT